MRINAKTFFYMSKKQKSAISTFSAQITSTISVTLVLLILGIVAFIGVAARGISNDLKENIGFVVMLNDSISVSELNALKQKWAKAPYVASQQFISADEALQQESERMGEDVLEMMAGINPYQPEFEIKLKPQYSSRDSIESITASLVGVKGIENIVTDTTMIDEINTSINNVIFALIIIAGALLLISFVLINNAVRLTVYSKRFIIHTMKLVGATGGYIRRPFIINNIVHGIFAAIIANAILAGIFYYLRTIDYSVSNTISWIDAAYIFGGLLIIGIVICSFAALFATNKYLRSSYDDMFK